jgi:hypothetical protein
MHESNKALSAARTYRIASHFDELLEAVADVEEAVLVVVGQVSRPKPPRAGQAFGGLVRFVHVAEHNWGDTHETKLNVQNRRGK